MEMAPDATSHRGHQISENETWCYVVMAFGNMKGEEVMADVKGGLKMGRIPLATT
jgi:hypothetical protein